MNIFELIVIALLVLVVVACVVWACKGRKEVCGVGGGGEDSSWELCDVYGDEQDERDRARIEYLKGELDRRKRKRRVTYTRLTGEEYLEEAWMRNQIDELQRILEIREDRKNGIEPYGGTSGDKGPW